MPRCSRLRDFGEVTAHEIAHHWVGDLVTPVWWDDIWLNESFAEWSGIKIADQWRPDLGLRTSLILDALGAMNVDSQRAGRPIRESIDDNTRIASTFDSITYEKGGGVLAMFESYLGEEVFQRGVHQHLLAHQHGNATAQDFFGALARAAGQPAIVDAFRTFVEQPGVPLITVTDFGRWPQAGACTGSLSPARLDDPARRGMESPVLRSISWPRANRKSAARSSPVRAPHSMCRLI